MYLQLSNSIPLGETCRLTSFNFPAIHSSVAFSASDFQGGPLVKYQPELNHLIVGTSINRSRNTERNLEGSRVFLHGVMVRLSNSAINESVIGAVKYLSAIPPR